MRFLAIRAGELYEGLENEVYHSGVKRVDVTQTNKQQAELELKKSRQTISQWVKMAKVNNAYQKVIEYCQGQIEKKEEATFKEMWAYLFGKAHVSYNSGENEWYTPPEYIQAARDVMGDIDLDPASTTEANLIIQARTFYSAQDNGLEQEWKGRVWMNPPYSSGLIEKFIEKLLNNIEVESISEAIVLVNNATDTKWFQSMLYHTKAICFPAGRIHFWNTKKESASPLQGQAILYFGDNIESFKDIFSMFGGIVNG